MSRLEGDVVLGRLVRHVVDEDLTAMVQHEGEFWFVYVFKDASRKNALGWVKLQLGDGGGARVSDYSVNLEELLKPVITYAEAIVGED